LGVERALGRRVPPDFKHVEKYPLSALLDSGKKRVQVVGNPGVMGSNWYAAFDNPVKLGKTYFVGVDSTGRIKSDLGRLRGGHAYCFKPAYRPDYPAWWSFYDQGDLGACVGFSTARALSLLTRGRWNPTWIWNEAKKIDPWPDTNPGDNEGTDVNSAMKVLLAQGAPIAS
jgi:hypothetical protein